MIKGTTKTGFRFSILEDSLDDMELLELIAKVDTNPTLIPKLIEKLLGKKQKERLYNHCRSEKGIVSSTKVSEELINIFSSTKIKN